MEHSSGVVLFKDNKFLLLKYSAGHWDLPKGHLENGETNEQAAIRELKEETGLTAQIIPGFEEPLFYFFHSHQTRFKTSSTSLVSKKVTFFLGKVATKNVVISHEHSGYQWLDAYDAYQQLTFQNAQQILKLADDFLVTITRSYKKNDSL